MGALTVKDSDRKRSRSLADYIGLRSHTIGTKSSERRVETDKYKREQNNHKYRVSHPPNDDFHEAPNNAHVCGCDLKILDTVDSKQQVGIATW